MAQPAKYLGPSWVINKVRHEIAITDWYYLGWLTFWTLPLAGLVFYHLIPLWPHYVATAIATALAMLVLYVPLYVSRRRRGLAAS